MSDEAKAPYKTRADQIEQKEEEGDEAESSDMDETDDSEKDTIRAGVSKIVEIKGSTLSSLPTSQLPLNKHGKYDFDDQTQKPRGSRVKRKLAQIIYYDSVAHPFICPVTQQKLTAIEAQRLCQLRWQPFSRPLPAPAKRCFSTPTMLEFVKLVRNYYGKQRAYGEKRADTKSHIVNVQGEGSIVESHAKCLFEGDNGSVPSGQRRARRRGGDSPWTMTSATVR